MTVLSGSQIVWQNTLTIENSQSEKNKSFKDILFINGCELEAPTWYRVNHQMEQLIANGLTADSVFYDALSLDMLKRYRGFVFFRCPITDTVREFIKQAKYFNKTCFRYR